MHGLLSDHWNKATNVDAANTDLKQIHVFERRASTVSEVFFILKHLDATKFVFLSVFTIVGTKCLKIWAKPPSKNEKKENTAG